jgi:hypothetical protein
MEDKVGLALLVGGGHWFFSQLNQLPVSLAERCGRRCSTQHHHPNLAPMTLRKHLVLLICGEE